MPQLVRVLGICAEISIPGRGADVRALAAVDCAGGTWEAQLSSPALQFVMRMREVRSVQHCVGSEVPACNKLAPLYSTTVVVLLCLCTLRSAGRDSKQLTRVPRYRSGTHCATVSSLFTRRIALRRFADCSLVGVLGVQYCNCCGSRGLIACRHCLSTCTTYDAGSHAHRVTMFVVDDIYRPTAGACAGAGGVRLCEKLRTLEFSQLLS